jgi:hypothetical protein
MPMVTKKGVVLARERAVLGQFVPGDADALSRVISDPVTANGHRLGALEVKTTGDDRRLRHHPASGQRRVIAGDRLPPS